MPSMYKMPVRNHILTVAVSIILASVIFSGILLKNNLDVVKNSKSSIALQQINVQELSTALGNLQFSVNLYIIFRRQSSLDSVRLYEKMFKTQSDDLYHTTLHNNVLKKQVEVIHSKYPIIINQLEYNLKKLPPKITADNVKTVFNESGSPFSAIWVALSQVRSYQNQSVKTSTNETIAAGSRSWSIAIMGSIFLMVVVLLGCIYINKIYKNWLLAEAKEKDSVALRKENEKLLQGVIDNCTAAIFIKDKSSKFIFVNKNFKQIHELENKDILGKSIQEVIGKFPIEYRTSAEDEILNSGEIKESIDHLIINHKPRYYLTTKFPLFDAVGEIFGLGGIATDITEQREYENELKQARELAEAAKISQQRFLANMSHEIRTPMNGVIGMTNLLESTALNEEQADYVNVIRQSSNILMLLINDILDVSKMQAGMLKLEKISFEVRESLKQIFMSYKPLANEKSITLTCDVSQDVPEFLMGDPLRLNQIISNLVNNAIKFTAYGGVSIKVTTSEAENGISTLTVAVTDSGIGIPADKLTDVFDSFTQSSTSTTRKYGGTGLGLAIVKELVEMQSGMVELVSEVDAGSTFTVTIPFQKASVDKSQQQKTRNKEKFSSLKDKRILVVEDNLINQKVVKQILLKAGFVTVDIADNGFIALDLLQKEIFDAVLMDVHMPEIDGLETTRRIRGNLKLTLPIIALTASALPEDRDICVNAGMNDYITKPFVPEDLLKKLSLLLP